MLNQATAGFRSTGRGESLVRVLALAALVGLCAGCRWEPPPPPRPAAATPAPVPDRTWTAEEITQDPSGYLKWADQKVAGQIADRENRLKRINARLSEIEIKRKDFDQNLKDVENLNRRMQQAVQRADDEDRWPVVVGGQSFDAARARVVTEQTARYVEDRRPMANEYRQASERLDGAALALRKDQEQLRRLREKIALDLERIRVSQGVEELSDLRRTEGEIASFAQALRQMADESLVTVPVVTAEDKARMEVDRFLRKAD